MRERRGDYLGKTVQVSYIYIFSALVWWILMHWQMLYGNDRHSCLY